MRSKPPKNNAVDKALIILSSFASHSHEWGTIELSQKLGFHKATVSRILLSLARHGFLNQDARTKKFSLGPEIMKLSGVLRQSLKTNLVFAAKPFVDDLRDAIKETVILEVLSGTVGTTMVYIAEGPRLVRLAGTLGTPLPIHAAAGGKAILAFLPREDRNRLLFGRLKCFTANTVTGRRELEKELLHIRENGVAYDREEIDEGTGAIACPIFDDERRPVASIVVAGPYERIMEQSETRVVPALKAEAARISGVLVCQGQEGAFLPGWEHAVRHPAEE
jgi:DNA-binding IclR family transcriptional regulator